MYKEHPVFNPPPDESTLWRYMDFTKFVSLLDTKALFFPKANKLGDPFEGSYSRANSALRNVLYAEKIPVKALQNLEGFNRLLPKWTMVSCWHEAKHESAAMWKLYSGRGDGIAVQTSFGSFKQSFTCSTSVFVGKVSYADYTKDFIPEGNSFYPYLHKRKAFEHENEVRALIMELPATSGGLDLSKEIQSNGIYCDVDITKLVERVVVAPYAQDWFIRLIQSAAKKYGLGPPVEKSELVTSPVWI